jgi:hypothetical protein
MALVAPQHLAELTAWLDNIGAGEFASMFAQCGYTTPQAVARSGLTEDNLREMGMSKMKTRKAVMNALTGVQATMMMPESAMQPPMPEAPPMMPELEPEMPVDAFFAAPAGGAGLGSAASPWGPGWAPPQPSAQMAPGTSETWNVSLPPRDLRSRALLYR